MDYSSWARDTFDVEIPQPGVVFAMSFEGGSKWGQRVHEALLNVELEYVASLCASIRDDDIPGAFVEFGTFEGWWVNHLFEVTDGLGLDRQVIGYDSFQGLSIPHPDHDDPFWKEGQYAASRDTVAGNVKLSERPRISLIEGFFSESLKSAEASKVGYIAFARIDCDIYEPALDCLRYLGPRLSHGSVLVFDDWSHRIDVGETKAFSEWVPTVPHLRFEFLFFGTWGHFYIRVWHRDRPWMPLTVE